MITIINCIFYGNILPTQFETFEEFTESFVRGTILVHMCANVAIGVEWGIEGGDRGVGGEHQGYRHEPGQGDKIGCIYI